MHCELTSQYYNSKYGNVAVKIFFSTAFNISVVVVEKNKNKIKTYTTTLKCTLLCIICKIYVL